VPRCGSGFEPHSTSVLTFGDGTCVRTPHTIRPAERAIEDQRLICPSLSAQTKVILFAELIPWKLVYFSQRRQISTCCRDPAGHDLSSRGWVRSKTAR
jgi:hypothetical protein